MKRMCGWPEPVPVPGVDACRRDSGLRLALRGCAVALLTATGVYAASPPDFRASTDLPALGLRLRLPARAAETPLPPLRHYTYQFRQGDDEWTETLFDPREIWLHAQHAGQWRDPSGNRFLLWRITHRLPRGFEPPHVTRDAYDRRLAESPALSGADLFDLRDWVHDYLETAPGAFEVLRFQPVRVRAAVFVPTGDPQRLLYLFRVHVRDAGARTAWPRAFAAELWLAPGVDTQHARQAFEQGFLRTLDVLNPPAGERAASDPLFASDDDTRRRSREDARQSIANLRGWWAHDTPHYIILSNQQRGNRTLVQDIETELERMRHVYVALVPPPRELQRISIIRRFNTPDEYVQYVGPERAWSGGLWDAGRGELVIRPLPGGTSREARQRLMQTLYHEAFHQYLSHATMPAQACAWFNEGHATFFEHTAWRQREARFQEHAPFVARVGELPLEALFALDYPAFYAAETDRRELHYATAWALVYYLQRGAASESRFAFRSLLADYLQALVRSGNGPRATRDVLRRINLAGLERDYLHFWDSQRRRSFAERAAAIPRR